MSDWDMVKSPRAPSRKRRMVVELVKQFGRPFTMDELIAETRRSCPEIGRSTVYRTILALEIEDRLSEVVTPAGRRVFVARSSPLVCLAECPQCGALSQINGGELLENARRVAADAGFTLLRALWTFTAACPQHGKAPI